ncbi:MAG: GNAT family N-acetyltransferase [Lachnospiraceae bacterium]|nr:GNAT family N-acetyltransferase [Lachnospiraceae bacterium]
MKKQVRMQQLNNTEKQETRTLWEENFPEDRREFLDYYYSEKTRENRILAMKEDRKLISMLHLNPYRLKLSGEIMQSYYIVAVATKQKYRHQGYMSILLRQALKQAEQEGSPFLFLMPAKEIIYEPFDFVTVYERLDYILPIEKESVSGDRKKVVLEVLRFSSKDGLPYQKVLQELVEFYHMVLSSRFDIYTVRDLSYVKESLLEQQSQNGGMLLFRKADTRELIGACYYTKEDEMELRELLCDKGWEKAILQELYDSEFCQGQVKLYGADFQTIAQKPWKKAPCIMVRITNLAALHGCFKLNCISETEPFQEHRIQLLDPLLPNQQGIYRLFPLERDNKSFLGIERLPEKARYQKTLTIDEFAKKYIKNQKIFLNEIV